jgi:hypothetical protein
VAGVAGQPHVDYMGATGGGVWKTDVSGITWAPITDGFVKTGSVGAIAVAPSDPSVIDLGMGEACIRSKFSHGDGVYKSVDAGSTWQHVGLSDSRAYPRDSDEAAAAVVFSYVGSGVSRTVMVRLKADTTYVDEMSGRGRRPATARSSRPA